MSSFLHENNNRTIVFCLKRPFVPACRMQKYGFGKRAVFFSQKSKSDKMLVMIAPRASYEARAVMSAFGA